VPQVSAQTGEEPYAPCLDLVPIGALPPAAPIVCAPQPLPTGRGTMQVGENAWLDDWQHGLSNADIGPGYVVFQNHNGTGAQDIPLLPSGAGFWIESGMHFRHADHWMTDVVAETESYGGHMLRPAKAFRFQDDKLVVEMDVAAGIEEYHGNAWAEMVVSTLDQPTLPTDTDTNGMHMFRGGWVAACKLTSGGHTFCGVVTPDGKHWTVSPQEDGSEAAHRIGAGWPSPAFRICQGTDPDANCRDRFRMEIERDRFALYVNGDLAMERSGFPAHLQLPREFLDAPVYPYAVSWVWKIDRNRPVARFHWDRFAVNPASIGTPPPPPPPPPVPTPTPPPPPTQVPTTAVPPTSVPPTSVPTQVPPTVVPPTPAPTPASAPGNNGNGKGKDNAPGQQKEKGPKGR
jgi:hypothetical protein